MAHYLLDKNLEYADLEALLGLTSDEQLNVNHNFELYSGNQWLNGEGNIGIAAAPDDPQATEISLRLQKRHIHSNKVKEITLRQRNAIFGVEPNFDFTVRRTLKKVPKMIDDPAYVPGAPPPPPPPADPADPKKPDQTEKPPQIPDPTGIKINEPLADDEQKLVDEAREAYLQFWDDQKPLKKLKTALRNRLLLGRGGIRLFVPAKFVSIGSDGKARTRPAKDMLEAIKMIYIEAVDADGNSVSSRVAEDMFTRDLLGITKLKRQTKQEIVDYLEISFVDDADRTFIGVFDRSAQNPGGNAAATAIPTPKQLPPAPASVENAANANANAAAQDANALPPEIVLSDPLFLNGKLTLFEMKGEALITPSMRRQQYLINHGYTMAGFTMTEHGISEMALTNVELETETIKDKDGKSKEIPKRLKRGGGVVNNFIGMETVGKDGSAQLATPGIHFKEPSSVETMRDGVSLGYEAMLQESCQQYALISGDATVSGESRIQAISDFFLFSGDFKTDADQLGVWLGETVINWAAQLCGRAKAFYDLRHTFESKLQVSLPSSDQRATNISEMQAGIKSKNRAMMDAGISDPDAENAQIAEEKRQANLLLPPALIPGAPIDPNNPNNLNDPKNPNLPVKKGDPNPPKPPDQLKK